MDSKRTHALIVVAALAAVVSGAAAQEAPKAPVSRAEYEKLRREVDDLKAQLATLPTIQPDQGVQPTRDALWETRLRLDALESFNADRETSDTGFHLSGFASTGYTDSEDENSTFSAGISPVFLWQLNDRLLFEAEFEFGLESVDGEGETEVELEYANGSYLLNDYITVGAGKFLTPFGLFGERLHPTWINKLPNMPFPYMHHGGIAPMTSLGAFVRGGIPLGEAKGNYSLYISNGPSLETEGHHPGTLSFENFDDANDNKALGGRIGFLPISSLELGYSFQFADVDASTFDQDVDSFIQGFDVSYVREYDAIRGVIDIRFEWVFSDVDDAVFFDEDDGEFFTFDNTRNGGYAQFAYRPTQVDIDFVKNLEIVGRYDWLDVGSGVPDDDKERWAIGLNYWLTNSSVIKLSYQQTDVDNQDETGAFLAQFAIGF